MHIGFARSKCLGPVANDRFREQPALIKGNRIVSSSETANQKQSREIQKYSWNSGHCDVEDEQDAGQLKAK